MLKKDIRFDDLDGKPQVETFYFNLNATELISLSFVQEGETAGGIENLLDKIIKEKNISKIIEMFSEFLSVSYGVRSDDGRRFIKSPELFEAFKQSPAYDALIMEMITDPTASGEFFAMVIPQNIEGHIAAGQMRAAAAVDGSTWTKANPKIQDVELPEKLTDVPDDPTPWITEDRDPTKAELVRMTKAQLQQAMAAKQRRRSVKQEDPELAQLRAAFDEE